MAAVEDLLHVIFLGFGELLVGEPEMAVRQPVPLVHAVGAADGDGGAALEVEHAAVAREQEGGVGRVRVRLAAAPRLQAVVSERRRVAVVIAADAEEGDARPGGAGFHGVVALVAEVVEPGVP